LASSELSCAIALGADMAPTPQSSQKVSRKIGRCINCSELGVEIKL
jgi:hypothetical protein